MSNRTNRRAARWLAKRTRALQFQNVRDPRRRRSVKWSLRAVLAACVTGLITGARSLADVEELTATMSSAMRRALALRGRIPDTTLRDLIVRLVPDQLRTVLVRQVRAAHRRKAIACVGLPWGVASLDGKATAIEAWDPDFAQRQAHGSTNGRTASGVIRTITACLITSPAHPCIDVHPVPASTNEVGTYKAALERLVRAYASIDLFRVVMYDAGGCSESNASFTRELGLHYVFGLDANQPTLFTEAQAQLGKLDISEADDCWVEQRGRQEVRRYLFRSQELAGWLDWHHLKTVVRVHKIVLDDEGQVVSGDDTDRYYVTSLRSDALSPRQWGEMIRRRWAVENQCHHTWDTVFEEDDHPWITASPQGAVVIAVLRRIAYNLMSLYRSVTLRSDENRATPWRRLVRWFHRAVLSVSNEELGPPARC